VDQEQLVLDAYITVCVWTPAPELMFTRPAIYSLHHGCPFYRFTCLTDKIMIGGFPNTPMVFGSKIMTPLFIRQALLHYPWSHLDLSLF